ncbi:MAG: tripartite tricarboxylate transporter permease [Rhodocyclaceae bacterium]|nr:tripartite tricarboxylate transporter permease [Rhodocyclaceae bacterium]MCE2980278.1 tripartite tricarboxylate transporter permease [Betaproteobacteria bacterium]MCA3076297.1 tripartite tricarboxylate transporter permease [Rhodocyclaceae bacterium]MCA3091815.1 tripartite tricarboxylate transporter permease [Rhodocyclaceae bacterium]MCA3093291.1 tripartite tricarboxylate transporter permease [Rhodocyclaceae bacterium]
MDAFDHLLNGFSVATQPVNLAYVFLGCLLGTVIGVLPGIGPAAAIALLLPITYGIEPTSSLIMLCGIYYGAMYGGSTTSILINTPGESSSVMTALDGYAMARGGRAGAALAISAIASFIAGTASVVLLSLLAVPLAGFALRFGPAEYFTLMLFAMTSVAALTGASLAKGLLSMFLGLMFATIGIDLQSGQQRFTFDMPELQDGIGFIVVVVGLFAIAEVFIGLEDLLKGRSEIVRLSGSLWLTRDEWRRSLMPIVRGTGIGFFKGVLPGAGATIATILSYSVERMLSRDKAKFGTGMIEGVAGPEAANNASTGGAMVPLLTLGVPGSGSTAVLLAAFIMYGLQPGPLLFEKRPDLVWGLIASMYIGNLVLLILNLPLVGVFVRLLYIPIGLLLPMVVSISAIGIFAVNGNIFELYLALGFGVIGYVFRKMAIPVAPLVLSLVLGGMMEQSFRQAMTISGADPGVFVRSPICIALLAASALALSIPFIAPLLRRFGRRTVAA